jgi:hypothetical protein
MFAQSLSAQTTNKRFTNDQAASPSNTSDAPVPMTSTLDTLAEETADNAEIEKEKTEAGVNSKLRLQPSDGVYSSSRDRRRSSEKSFETWFKDFTETLKIQGGVRALYTHLMADRKGEPFNDSFIGSIYGLDADQDYLPYRPYVQAVFYPGMGFGMSYDRLRVATVDDGGGDGDVVMDGFYLYLLGEYQNETIFTPYLELGYVFYNNRFDAKDSWSDNGRREFALEDSGSIYFGGGCDIDITPNWYVGVYARYVNVDVDGSFIFRGDDRPPEDFVFTMEHMSYGIGAGFRFP